MLTEFLCRLPSIPVSTVMGYYLLFKVYLDHIGSDACT